jgi:exodeoxyribonuclease VII small subunit
MAKEKMGFEKAMARLEQIVAAIEQGKVGLEDSIQQFEEGMALIRQCRAVLAEAEMKVQQLQVAGTDAAEIAPGAMPPPAAP